VRGLGQQHRRLATVQATALGQEEQIRARLIEDLISSALFDAEKSSNHSVTRGDRGFVFVIDTGELGEVDVDTRAGRRPPVRIERKGRQSPDVGVVDYAPARGRGRHQATVTADIHPGSDSPSRGRYPAIARMSEIPVDPSFGLHTQGVDIAEELASIFDAFGTVAIDYNEAGLLPGQNADVGIWIFAP